MIKTFVYFLVLAVLLIVFFQYAEQRSLYFPSKSITDTPKNEGMLYDGLSLLTSDAQKIQAWFIPKQGAKNVILFFHGNGGNLSHRLEKISFFHSLGFNVFIMDYRGYGKSSGSPSEQGLYKDAQSSYDYLITALKFKPEQIILFGESLGAAVATEMALKNKVGAVILESAFSSVSDMTKQILPLFPTLLLRSRFDSYSKINSIKVPKMFIHSHNDEIVPYALGRKLYEKAASPKLFVEISGGHNEAFFWHEEKIKKQMRTFFDAYKLF